MRTKIWFINMPFSFRALGYCGHKYEAMQAWEIVKSECMTSVVFKRLFIWKAIVRIRWRAIWYVSRISHTFCAFIICSFFLVSWWRHQMEIFSALLAICVGNSPVNGEFPAQRPVTRSFGVFFDLQMNERLSKQSWGWWFEEPSRPFWCLSNVVLIYFSHSFLRYDCPCTMQ